MNPYASFLGDLDACEVIALTPERLDVYVTALGPDVDKQPAPGKWSVREILCHLTDCELVFAFRLRQTLAEPHHIIQPFDQDLWAKNYAAYDANTALKVFKTVRDWNVRLIDSLDDESFSKKVNHPERGDMTFATIVETMGGHDLNHLAQIEKIATNMRQQAPVR